jgi:hypothetical protein
MNFPGSDEDRRLVGMVTKFDPIGDGGGAACLPVLKVTARRFAFHITP